MKHLWQKLWLLFSVIWIVVASLQVFAILAFSDEAEKVARPILLGVAVPALAWVALWLWFRWRK